MLKEFSGRIHLLQTSAFYTQILFKESKRITTRISLVETYKRSEKFQFRKFYDTEPSLTANDFFVENYFEKFKAYEFFKTP